jgi:cation-transporting ATPase I
MPAFLRRVAATHPVESVSRALAQLGAAADEQPAGEPPEAVSAELAALGVHLAGAGLAVAGSLTRLARLPVGVPALLSTAANIPHVRAALQARLGPNHVEPGLAAAEAAVGALAGSPAGMLVDAVHRVQRLAEARARERVWRKQQADGGVEEEPGGNHTAAEEKVPPRPRPLPDGPVERYAAKSAVAGAAGWASALLAGQPSLGVAALTAGSAKPARLAKESFAARLGRWVAELGVMVDDPRALRRLDRIDAVVVDAAVLTTGRWAIDEVSPLDGGPDAPDLHARALGLVDPEDPTAVRERDGWRTEPAGSGRRLHLYHGARRAAVVSLLPELDPYAEALVAAASVVGEVWVAGRSSHLDERLKVTGVLPSGPRLTASVRGLQADGRGVLLVARPGRTALGAADVGIAVASAGAPGRAGRSGRGGHLRCGCELVAAVEVLEAVPAARHAASTGVRLAEYQAAAAGVLGLASPHGRAGHNALLGSHIAALAGIGAGMWYADPVVRMRPPQPADRNPWHAIPVREVLRRLRSSPAGLPGQEARQRRPESVQQEAEGPGVARAVAEELANPLTPALAAGAGLAAAVGSTVDAALIGGVVVANSLVGGLQRLGADRAVRRLAQHASVPVRLLREGKRIDGVTEDLVPGDIIDLRPGDAVPADCRIVEADRLEVDEANLTGESLPVAKTAKPSTARVPADRVSMVYEGTAVAAGHGLAAVVATGPDTEARQAEQQAGAPRIGGVQGRLQELTKSTLPLSAGAGALLLGANVLRGQPLRQAFAPAVSLAVASVPEGLPSVATMAQLAAARRLSRRGVLVRNPATLEALGRVQALCFDKTGTLTEGRLRLRLVSDGTDEAKPEHLPERLRGVLAAALRATPASHADQDLADPTDRAIAAGGNDTGVTVQDGQSGWERVDELPFEPCRGLHAVLGAAGGAPVLSVKGTPEAVIGRCSARATGEPLDDAARRGLTRAASRLAGRGYRMLAVAEAPMPAGYRLTEEHLGQLTEAHPDQLRFLGLVALADRVRPSAAEAVAKLRRAGVRVIMVTGDHPGTAESVAAELGVLDGGEVLSGADIDRMSDDELTALLPRVTVFARSVPAQKVRVVRLLRRAGQAVAVTGDGANDAPAMRAAHVGIALGSQATPAARAAADVVVTDDGIETVVDAVVEGRVLWSSVRDALAVLLGGNVGEIAFTVGAGILGGPGLDARQLLLVNMLTDVVPALVLASRAPSGTDPRALLAGGPDASLGPALRRDIEIRAAATAGATGAAWLLARFTGTSTRACTVALVSLVSTQLVQTALASGFDPVVTAACAGSLALLTVAVQTPGLSHVLGSRPLGPVGWSTALGSSVVAAAGARWYGQRAVGDDSAGTQQAAQDRRGQRDDGGAEHLHENLGEQFAHDRHGT